jgi:hypothetical protein
VNALSRIIPGYLGRASLGASLGCCEFGCEFRWPRARGECFSGLAPT